jgi:dTDP-4-dehydrorhamnose 3,5-epimerase
VKVLETKLPGLLVIEPAVFRDTRGDFVESWHCARYSDIGLASDFVQDNVVRSVRNVLRGLHYQQPHPQAKLVFAVAGEVFDVAVDLRLGSPTFGEWHGQLLSETNHMQMYIPEGFAHGYAVLSDVAVITYKCTDYYDAAAESGILWSDPELAIEWPVKDPVLSQKDRNALPLRRVPRDRLCEYDGAAPVGSDA